MDTQPLYNSRIISTFVEYLRSSRPEVNTRDLLEQSGISSYEIEDEGHWLTQHQVDSFQEAVVKVTGDPQVFREAGRYMLSSNSAQALRQLLIGFISPTQAFMMLDKVASYLNRASTFKTTKINSNTVEIVNKPLEGVTLKPYQCENNKGTFEAVAELFSHTEPALDHPECLHRGDDCCRYRLTWKIPGYVKWRRAGNYIAVASILAILGSLLFLPPFQVAALAVVFAILVTAMAYHTMKLEKKDLSDKLEAQGDSANRLLDQITISYNNALLVQEIGQAVTSTLDIDQLMTVVMQSMEKRLAFDRAMIMLADPVRSRLLYMNGYGYSPEHETFLRETVFSLNNPRSRAPFAVTFREQKPFLIDDVAGVTETLSPRTIDFIKKFGVTSFICVPIVYEGTSEGILAVDNYRTHRPLNQSEVSLLLGVAQQIAISINNARAVRQIIEKEKRFRALSENSPDIIYTTDERGTITYISPAAENILEYKRKEMVGRRFDEFAMSEETERLRHFFNQLKQGRKTIRNYEVKLLPKNGGEKLFFISGARDFDSGEDSKGFLGTLRDFTEQRKLQVQLQHAERMNALGRLTGGIAHDFNNILQAITSYNQLLTVAKSSDHQDWKYLSKVNELTKRATDLVGQLLVFSRKVEATRVPMDMNSEIESFSDLITGALPDNISLTMDLADESCLISGDKSQLGQVLMNLAVNARDAMPDGGSLTIRTDQVSLEKDHYRTNVRISAGNYVLLSIEDSGQGIEKENLDHIFEPYFTTKEPRKGTGIGLSVVYGIVKNHEGFIFCDSSPSRGTIFDIYLPSINGTVDLETEESQLDSAALSGGRETILLVDDEVLLLETGKDLLELLGYTVLTADSGEKALSVLRENRRTIAVVVLDLLMPGMSGEQCLDGILKLESSMKVIVASGYAGNLKAEDLIDKGAADFIQKPYQIETLSSRIRDILDHDVSLRGTASLSQG